MRVTVTYRDGEMKLSVSDEGPGFPDAFLPRVFDPFTRGEAARTVVMAAPAWALRSSRPSPKHMGGIRYGFEPSRRWRHRAHNHPDGTLASTGP